MITAYKLVPAPLYLSGNVRAKLRDAQTAASLNPIFLPNVEQLEAAQPAKIKLIDIDTSFASIWIPLRFFKDFIQDVLDISVHVRYCEINASWSISPLEEKKTIANSSTYGVQWQGYSYAGNLLDHELTAIEIIELSMNLKTPSINRRPTRDANSGRDAALTAGAIEKQRLLQERFTDWLRSNPERREELENRYNNTFNSVKLPTFDGSHLTLPGMSAFWRNRIRDYQLNGIYRGLLGNAGIFYEVGLGKTLTGIAIVMERRRIDPTTRAVIIVKRSTLTQFADTFREAYPAANILVATEEDCSTRKRQLFMARMAAGNYDATIMTQQQYEKLRMKSETLRRFIEPMLERVVEALKAEGVDEEDEGDDRKRKSYTVKGLERIREKLRAKVETLAKKRDVGLFFEDLGINLIVADEADSYLNQTLMTKLTGISGLSMNDCGLATDFEWKAEYLRRVHGPGRLILKTGTFVRNTMANLYVMQRLLQPEALESRGIHCFDAWASLFGRVKTAAEINTSGGISRKSRFSEFVNLPELLQMFLTVAEIKRYEDVADASFTRPTAKFVTVCAPMSEQQLAIMDDLVKRSEEIRANDPRWSWVTDSETGKRRKKYDNMLWVSTDGRKACLEARLVDPFAEDFYKSKINQCGRRVFKIWRRTRTARSTQMVFLDLSTPGSDGYSAYRDLKAKWIDMGIPSQAIAFIQDYKTDQERKALFDDFNDPHGVVRILMGSTQTMGVGVNAQAKLIALHHLDCPWRPCDLEQREGRAIRSGNENTRVLIYRYVTQGRSGNCGFDSFMWQLVAAKTKFIRQVMSGDLTIRRLEEDASEDPSFSAGQVCALATGDPNIMLHTEVIAQLDRLKSLERSIELDSDALRFGHRNSLSYSRHIIRDSNEVLVDHAQDFEAVKERLASCTGEAFKITLIREPGVRKDYTDRTAAGKELVAMVVDFINGTSDDRFNWKRFGFYGGFELLIRTHLDRPRTVECLLRGPSQKTYEVTFVQNAATIIERIQWVYEGVLRLEATSYERIARHEAKISEVTVELASKEHAMGDVRAQIQEFSLERTRLEVALGLSQNDELASQEIGGEDEE